MLSKRSRICCWSIRKSSMKPDSFRTVILRHGPRYYGAEQVDAAAERWGDSAGGDGTPPLPRETAVAPHAAAQERGPPVLQSLSNVIARLGEVGAGVARKVASHCRFLLFDRLRELVVGHDRNVRLQVDHETLGECDLPERLGVVHVRPRARQVSRNALGDRGGPAVL